MVSISPVAPMAHSSVRVIGIGFLVAVAALLVRTGILPAHAEFDELYHLLAARSWNDTGTLAILDGEYTRGAYYTKAVAATMDMLGSDNLSTARLFSLLIGVLTPVVVFFGVNRVAGLGAAMIVAVYMVLWPQGILESQSVRFYGVQVITFLIGAYAFYRATEPEQRFRLGWAVLMVLAWAAAFHFQITSIVGIAGAFAGMFCILVMERVKALQWRIAIFGGVLALMAGAVAVAASTGLLERAWEFYRWTPGHAAALRDYVGFYHNQFESRYGFMWLSIPIWVCLALYARPRLAFYALSIFVTCFLVHSFSGMKSLRYLSYASPMLFLVWAIGFIWIWEQMMARLNPQVARWVAAVGIIALLALSEFPRRSYDFARGEGYSARADWTLARETIGDWADAPFKLTTHELHMVAYISDYDMVFSSSRVSEMKPSMEFAEDFRTGRRMFGTPESMLAVLACAPEGVLVTTPLWWENEAESAVFQETIAQAGYEMTERAAGDVHIVRWDDPTDAAPDCSGVPSAG